MTPTVTRAAHHADPGGARSPPPGRAAPRSARLSEPDKDPRARVVHRDLTTRPRLRERGASRMTDAVCTTTRFFRDTEQLGPAIERKLDPEVAEGPSGRARPIRVWSAGCSTGGEEALSQSRCSCSRDCLSIKASRSRSSRPTSPPPSIGPAPRAGPHSVCRRSPRPTGSASSRSIRNRRPRADPGAAPTWSAPAGSTCTTGTILSQGKFNLNLLLRNVLIYSDTETRAGVTGAAVERLAPEGLLLLGFSESLLALREGA